MIEQYLNTLTEWSEWHDLPHTRKHDVANESHLEASLATHLWSCCRGPGHGNPLGSSWRLKSYHLVIHCRVTRMQKKILVSTGMSCTTYKQEQHRTTLCSIAVDKYIHAYLKLCEEIVQSLNTFNALSDLCLSACCGSARSSQPIAGLYALQACQDTKWQWSKQSEGFEAKLTSLSSLAFHSVHSEAF